jgi:hypothetical protein
MASFDKDDMWRDTRGLDVETWFWTWGWGEGGVGSLESRSNVLETKECA